MGTTKKLIVIVAILLCGNLIIPILFSGVKEKKIHVSRIAMERNGWKGVRYDLKPMVKKILETDQVFSFLYTKKEAAILLSIVYYSKGQIAFHMPEGCTEGVGEKIIDQGTLIFPGAWGDSAATYFKVQGRNGDLIQYAYFFATDEKATGNYFLFRSHLTMRGLTKNVQSCALLRMSVIKKDNGQNEEAIFREFWKDLSPSLRMAMSG